MGGQGLGVDTVRGLAPCDGSEVVRCVLFRPLRAPLEAPGASSLPREPKHVVRRLESDNLDSAHHSASELKRPKY